MKLCEARRDGFQKCPLAEAYAEGLYANAVLRSVSEGAVWELQLKAFLVCRNKVVF